MALTVVAMRRAFAKKDPAFDGVFFVAVKTTGIFCRPVCRDRTPRPEHIEFFPSIREALHAGYRACKRCRPLDGGSRPPPVVAQLVDTTERNPTLRLAERHLTALGIDPSTARRQFRRWCGMTFQQYQRARRMGVAMARIRKGAHVIEAQLETGYASGSGFREAFSKMFGVPPLSGAARALVATWLETPLGSMVAIADEDGIRLLDFVDRRGLERAVLRLRGRAAIVPGMNPHLDQLRRELAEYFAGSRTTFDVAITPQRGTIFQVRAWNYLRTIPFGETRSYGDEASAIGSPSAFRAVGSANGLNYLSILVPCHRVIGSDGSLTGYGGGLARKRRLLDHERGLR